ncbi:S-adenosylmethionine:tRNA ribosyltransferase-isomerase [uncultured Hymenobacter sp.]|uniref:S-adenosylmethionine:tRNA ribosyltransferase-isomerase n=1 Tax=uncultured Hymenobacter sp. TaxID=170016 RepID=UPI0035CB097D
MPSHPRDLSIHDFSYPLPPERIAGHPAAERGGSRLLVSRGGQLSDRRFAELPAELPADSLLIFNDTRVLPARLLAYRPSGGAVELFCLEPVAPPSLELALAQTESCTWKCLVGRGQRWKSGPVTTSFEADGQPGTLRAGREGREDAESLIRFQWEPARLSFSQVLAAAGQLPLPPYLRRSPTAADALRYQTVYAAQAGAVAAPTAGLHFTPEVLAELSRRGTAFGHLTLHVGAGTFQPVKAARMADHAMHAEPLLVRAALLRQLLAHQRGPVIAVGTTSLRTLESLYWLGAGLLAPASAAAAGQLAVGQWQPYEMLAAAQPTMEAALRALLSYLEAQGAEVLEVSTRLLIAPGYSFRVAQGLITNFHQPESTLLLLVAALLGPDWRQLYAHALAHGYQFLSYGDSSLLLP